MTDDGGRHGTGQRNSQRQVSTATAEEWQAQPAAPQKRYLETKSANSPSAAGSGPASNRGTDPLASAPPLKLVPAKRAPPPQQSAGTLY